MQVKATRGIKSQRHLTQVHKFGGTCLATASRISEAASHIIDTYRASGDQQMVVVSAMGSHITSPVKVPHLIKDQEDSARI